MIRIEEVKKAKEIKLGRLTNALEDQDYLLQDITDKMPRCQERRDLLILKNSIIKLLGKIDKMQMEMKE